MATSSPSQKKIRHFKETISLQSQEIENLSRRLEAKDTRIKILDQTIDNLSEQLRFLEEQYQDTMNCQKEEYHQYMESAKKEVLYMGQRVEKLTETVRQLSEVKSTPVKEPVEDDYVGIPNTSNEPLGLTGPTGPSSNESLGLTGQAGRTGVQEPTNTDNPRGFLGTMFAGWWA